MTVEEYYLESINLYETGKYIEALEAINNAIESGDIKRVPELSFFIGSVLEALGKDEEALIEYNKAIQEKDDKKFPTASYCVGVISNRLRLYKQALNAFNKAILDSDGQKYPEASYNLGVLLKKTGRDKEALEAYKKAIVDSDQQKYPSAYSNMGIILYELGQYTEALEAYNKAIEDSDGQRHPQASYNIGILFSSLGQNEIALKALNKAILESTDQKFPMASYNIGILLNRLEQYEEALNAFNKSIMDSTNQKFPMASFNMGVIFKNLGITTATSPSSIKVHSSNHSANAEQCFRKAISDSENGFYPKAHYRLSKILLPNDPEQAKAHAYIALEQNNKDTETLEHILANYGTNKTIAIYQNRISYLTAALERSALQHGNTHQSDDAALDRLIGNISKTGFSHIALFQSLLRIEDIEFVNPISHKERLQLCYLLHFMNSEPWQTFYIIDELIDGDYELDEMDYYFYVASSYLIGQPVYEFDYFINDVAIDISSIWGNNYSRLAKHVHDAVDNKTMHDPYILNIQLDDFTPAGIVPDAIDAHPWIKTAIASVTNPAIDYTIPVSANELSGLSSQVLAKIFSNIDESQYTENKSWLNVKYSLNGQPLHYSTVVDNIREAIEKGIPYLLILKMLFDIYKAEQDTIKKKNIAIMQAAVLISHKADYLKKPLNYQSHIEIPVSVLADMGAHSAIAHLIAAGVIVDFGLSVAISYISNISFKAWHEHANKKKAELAFEQLLNEIE